MPAETGSTGAYRAPGEVAPIATWQVRTSRGHRLALLAVTSIAVGAHLWIFGPARIALFPAMLVALFTMLPLAILAAIHLRSRDEERVAGGAGAIALYDERLVVARPRGRAGEVDEFPLAALRTQLQIYEITVNFVRLDVEILCLEAGDLRRRLSSRLFADPAELHRLARAIDRVQRGLPFSSIDEATGEAR